MKVILPLILLSFQLFIGCNNKTPTKPSEYLLENFKNPPVDARPKALWDWVNGNFNLSQTSFYFENESVDQVMLNLGKVYEIARVYLNGYDLGDRWHAPYSYDISSTIKPGINYLTVEVANLMNNQMVGDANVPESYKRTHSNIDKGPTPWTRPWKEVELKPSGLIGPVSSIGYGKD